MIECDSLLLLNPDMPYCATITLKNFNAPKDEVERFLVGFRITDTEYLQISDDNSDRDYNRPVLSYFNHYHSSSKATPELKVILKTSFFSECGATYEGMIDLLNPETSNPLLYTDCKSEIFSSLCRLLCKVNIRKTTVLYADN